MMGVGVATGSIGAVGTVGIGVGVGFGACTVQDWLGIKWLPATKYSVITSGHWPSTGSRPDVRQILIPLIEEGRSNSFGVRSA